MQKIAITDANIFIDLIETEIFEYLFQFGIKVHTTYEVFDQLSPNQQEILKSFELNGELVIYCLSYYELVQLENLQFPAGLELADRSVYFYANNIQGLVLSGDRKLKKYCESKQLRVNGIIWVFDQIHEFGLIQKADLVFKLKLLMKINKRLPVEECNKRIHAWLQG